MRLFIKTLVKNIVCALAVLMLFSCSNSNEKAPVADSANAIDDRPIPDTTTDGKKTDGYAPPDSTTAKDSIDTLKH